ncbi:HAD family hydrolase [Bosea sp. TAF32]|uniref:HAD family hydrolase n=1 Tax=Bosea sp. TAF32 TaxID=3237482 RepID=UPI003F93DF54
MSEVAAGGRRPAATADEVAAIRLLEQLKPIRAGGVELHLATVQEYERARHIWEELALRDRFDGMHYAAALGAAKPDARFFAAAQAGSGFRADEIFFIDDEQANIDAARR